jgi:N,N'-diacetylchitobiose transport system permease protein
VTTTAPAGTGAVPPETEEEAAAVVAGGGGERRSLARSSRRGRRRPWIGNSLAAVFCVVWIFPVYWMVNTAFKPRSESMSRTPGFLPQDPTISNFVAAFTNGDFLLYLRNSTIVVAGAVVLSILLGLLAAAALSRFSFRGRRPIMVAILVVQMLPATALLIPQFLIFTQIGLIGTYLGLVLAYVGAVLPFTIWVMRGFFLAIPVELEEAARIDGCSTWQVLTRILFPLVANTFMQDQSHYTLPVWLASFTTQTTGTDFGAQMAASVLFSLPVVVFFMIIQRNLVSGMSAGAVKG